MPNPYMSKPSQIEQILQIGEYDWSQIDEGNPIQVEAFKKVCQITGRYFIYHRTQSKFLFRSNSWNGVPVELYKKISTSYDFKGKRYFLNPHTTVREISAQHVVQSRRSREDQFEEHYYRTIISGPKNPNQPNSSFKDKEANELVNTENKLRSLSFSDPYYSSGRTKPDLFTVFRLPKLTFLR